MPTVPTTRMALIAAIEEHGPLSAAELTEAIPRLSRQQVDGSLILSRGKYGTEHFRIVNWRRQIGHGGREIPVYGLGPGPDAPRPTLGKKARRETWQRFEEANRELRNTRNRMARGRTPRGPFAGLGQRTAR